jgi:hypothetical protein
MRGLSEIAIVLDDAVQFAGQHLRLLVAQFKVHAPEMGTSTGNR